MAIISFEVIYEIFPILNCGCEIKYLAMILTVMNAIYTIACIEAWKV